MVWSCPYCPMRKHSHRLMTYATMCGPSTGRGRLFTPPTQPLNVWINERRRRRGENRTRMTNSTGQGLGRLRRGAALPKERHPPGRWSGKTQVQLHLPWAAWVRALGYFSACCPQQQHPRPSATVSRPPEETVEPSQEEPAQVPSEQVAPEEAPGPSWLDTSIPEDLAPMTVMLQDVRDYLMVAGEHKQALIRAELTPYTGEASNQATLLPAHRSFPSPTPPSSFTMSQNPDGSVTLEYIPSTSRFWTPLPTGSSHVKCNGLVMATRTVHGL